VVGDAFGSALEGAPATTAAALADRRAASTGPWGYTDDGSMFIAVAESIRASGTVSPVGVLEALSRRYEPARGFGRGMKLALRAFENGTPWQDVARAGWPEGSRGNGGAVRVGAVALRRWASTPDLERAATMATRVTHAHPEAVDAALRQAHLVAMAVFEPARFACLIAANAGAAIAGACGTSTFARESVPAAHAAFFRSHTTFQHAVTTAASLGGDVDSICCIVECLAGALHGLSGIPATWLQAIEHESPSVDELCDLADNLLSFEACPYIDI
jgi:poly(ADP-ribose) glycohydrolase ARH3